MGCPGFKARDVSAPGGGLSTAGGKLPPGTGVAAVEWINGKPGDEALHAKCFPCHAPAKDRDFVFTRYAPTP
jgi:hypothetical protein